MRHPAGLEDIAAGAYGHLLVAHPGADLALHMGELVLALVDVWGDESARLQRVLHDRELAGGVLSPEP